MSRAIVIAAFSLAVTFGQQAAKFEVAAVYVSKDPPVYGDITITGTSVVAQSVNMKRLIAAAYGMRARFVEGPSWIDSWDSTFDLKATIPSGAPARLVPEMLQSLLEERFKLKFHIDQQERNVYALLVAQSGARLQASKGIDESKPGGMYAGIFTASKEKGATKWASPNGSSYRLFINPDGGAETTYVGATLPEFAFHLNTLDGLDIVDMTQIQGRYDMTMTSTALENCEPCKTPPPPPPLGARRTPDTKESLAKLGLRLEKRKAKVDVFKVDSVEKAPTAN
jgi:uncharacterized protein (TIGR03435 family)